MSNLALHVLLKSENPRAFEAHERDILARLQPADEVELSIAETVIHATWRLHRLLEVETTLLEMQMNQIDPESPFDPDQPRVTLAKDYIRQGEDIAEAVDRVLRIQSSLDRMIARAYRNLSRVRRDFPKPDAPDASQLPKPESSQRPPTTHETPNTTPKQEKCETNPRPSHPEKIAETNLKRKMEYNALCPPTL